jgi:hypothetical protein
MPADLQRGLSIAGPSTWDAEAAPNEQGRRVMNPRTASLGPGTGVDHQDEDAAVQFSW